MESYKREVSRAFLKMVWQDGLGPTLCGLCHVGVAGDTGCPVPRSRILLYGTSQTLRFYKLKVCGNPK